MKAERCAICGNETTVMHEDCKGGVLYGIECLEGHLIPCVFGTKNRAVQAWNECQRFVIAYTEEVSE